MPLRQTSGASSSSRGKSRHQYKPYYRKGNPNASNRQLRSKDTSSSDPQAQATRTNIPKRSFSQAKIHDPGVAGRYSTRRKPSVGIFGEERATGNGILLRKLENSKPKGDVPAWLSETFGHLPNRHPLRKRVTDSPNIDPVPENDESNPFAFQPPSPPQTPTAVDHTSPVPKFPAEDFREDFRPPRIATHRINLSSIPFAPPRFIEPTYEEHYQDATIPLNDDYEYEPEKSGYLVDNLSHDWQQSASPPILHAPVPIPRFAPPQRILSPTFLSGVYPGPDSPVVSSPLLNNISSDDFTLPTPTHNVGVVTPQKDEIQDALRTKHSFVTSVYASSPAGSFRGFPLDTLVGSRDSSPYAYPGPGIGSTAHESKFVASPIPQPIWIPGRQNAHTPVQPRPASSDVYKTRLLAYATAMVDQMSSSGDEAPAYGSQKGTEGEYENWESALEPENDHKSMPSRPQSAGRSATRTRPLSFSFSGYGLGGASAVMKEQTVAHRNRDYDGLARSSLPEGLSVDPHPITGLDTILETDSEPSDCGGPLEIDLSGVDSADIGLVEDWQNEPHSQNMEDNYEETGPSVSEYEIMQAEYDALAADEPSDGEEEGTVEPTDTTRQEDHYPVPEQANAISTVAPEPPKKKPGIQPFPMTISRRDSSPPAAKIDPGNSNPVLARLSPKFDPRSVRRVRPSPFAALLKKRHGEQRGISGVERKGNKGDLEDDIESWPG